MRLATNIGAGGLGPYSYDLAHASTTELGVGVAELREGFGRGLGWFDARLAGYFRDAETGNDYAINRYHQPGMGRFLTLDPYMAKAGGAQNPSNPGSWNKYAYVVGDPINGTDRRGLYVDCDGSDCTDYGGDGSNCVVTKSVDTDDGCDDGATGSTSCGANQFEDSNGNCEDEGSANSSPETQDCTMQMYTRMLSGFRGFLLGFLGTHSYLVVTETGAPTVTFDGRHNGNLLQGAYATPGSSTSDPTNNPNNPGGGYAFSTVADGPPVEIPCSDIGSMEQAVTNFNSGPPVMYHTFGTNSNSFLNWLLNQVGLGGLYGQPPGGWGWNTPIPGH